MVVVDDGVCDRCGACICVCQDMALVLTDRIGVDHKACTRCGRCVRVCPYGALSMNKDLPGGDAPVRGGVDGER